jgi:uncharacterized protein (TIGR00730 family)
MSGSICVFCSSSSAVPEIYMETARALGRRIVRDGYDLVYGGADVGLMGQCAMAAAESGGRVTGVIPEVIYQRGLADRRIHELIVTADMRSRKARMEELADAFIALPGGFGTLEEVMEILTLKQLQSSTAPVIFLNVNGFYDGLFAFFESMKREKFIKPEYMELFFSARTIDEAFAHIAGYRPAAAPLKWF